MQQQKETERAVCSCAQPQRIGELCPPCLAEWQLWHEEDMRSARMYAAYGPQEEAAA